MGANITDLIQELGIDPVLYDFLQKLGLSLMIGILIGIEREHWRKTKKIFAGVRTFAITCITGMISTFVADVIGPEILYITTFFITLYCILLAYSINVVYRSSGMTSAIALFCTYLLGVLVAKNFYLFAIAGALVVTFLLIEKKPLHSFAEHLSDKEILNAVEFLTVALILYPIAPSAPIFGVVNLQSVILIVVLVSSISFASYVSLKKLGTKGGLSYSGLLGGFVSSDATVVALSSISKRRPILNHDIYMGLLLALASMFVSNTIIAFIVDPSGRTAYLMLPPHLVMLVLTLFIFFTKRKEKTTTDEEIKIQSPFALGPAFKFGAIFTILLVVANTANDIAGPIGIYATALGGIVSSSAVTASMAALAVNGEITFQTAAETAVLATIVSILNKPFFIKVTGSKELFVASKNIFVLIVIIGSITLAIWSYYTRFIIS